MKHGNFVVLQMRPYEECFLSELFLNKSKNEYEQ